MTAIENLRALKLRLEQQLKASPSAEEREWIEGELMKIDIALSFLTDGVQTTINPTYPEINSAIRSAAGFLQYLCCYLREKSFSLLPMSGAEVLFD